MAREIQQSGKLEWRVNIPNGTTEILEPAPAGRMSRICRGFQGLIIMKIWNFLNKAWHIGVNDPKKVIHCLKVGLALSLVSFFYYMRPLYDGVGGNAMWAVMTVVVVFEYTVGSTLYKCVNRAIGTFLAGSLGIGVHWIANHSGEKFEPVILQASVFLLAAAATFSRFIPTIKARFDYGAMIFILTFSLVSVSGYRVDKLFELAHQRLSTIAIGTSICIVIGMLFCPVWAGNELHNLISNNLEKLADSLDGCVAEYFGIDGVINSNKESSSKKLQGYKCVLNSKSTEESMANFARWEPAHGRFNFGHPWKQYLKVGASMRGCAYCIETLHGCINTDTEESDLLKKRLSGVCSKLSSYSANVIRELAIMVNTMTKSSTINLVVEEMKLAVQDLQNALKSFPDQSVSIPGLAVNASHSGTTDQDPITQATVVQLMEIVPLLTVASLLIEIAARIEGIVDQISELSKQAEFKEESSKMSKQRQSQHIEENQDNVTMKTLQ